MRNAIIRWARDKEPKLINGNQKLKEDSKWIEDG